jgi:hypothetical protein
MPHITQSEVDNRLLKALRLDAFGRFVPHLELIDLPLKHVLAETDQPTTDVC